MFPLKNLRSFPEILSLFQPSSFPPFDFVWWELSAEDFSESNFSWHFSISLSKRIFWFHGTGENASKKMLLFDLGSFVSFSGLLIWRRFYWKSSDGFLTGRLNNQTLKTLRPFSSFCLPRPTFAKAERANKTSDRLEITHRKSITLKHER